MINKIKTLWFRFQAYAKKHREYFGIVVAVLIMLIFPPLIRRVDSSAAPIDPGVLSAIVLAVIAILVFKSVTWWIIRSIWPVLADYFTQHFVNAFKNLQSWQKITIALLVYFCVFFSFVVALVAIL
jgi:hypothetical protein